MSQARTMVVAKILEAIGIAATMIGLVRGFYSDMWGELYFFLGGIFVFLIGRQMEKHVQRKNTEISASH